MPRVILPALFVMPVLFAQTTGSVEGTVFDRITGAGIPDASVTVYLRALGLTYDATTDGSGEFRIFGMKPGNYEVRFEKDGYRFGNKIPPQPYRVGQGQDPVHIRLEMTRQVSFSGRVLDPDGNPVSQADVRLAGRFAAPVAADGTFTIKELEPGSYTLAAIPKSMPAPEGARVPVTTYSPEPIVIRGDTDVSGYEIRLETAEVYRINGTVLDETGNPKAGVAVQLLPTVRSGPRVASWGDPVAVVGIGPHTGPEEARVVSGADGSFEFPAVRSGEWQLAATITGSIDSVNYAASIRSGALPVVVGGRNVSNLQIRFGAGFKLTGTVDWGDSPVRRAGFTLPSLDGALGRFNLASFDAAGNFTIDGVSPGKHLILPQPPGYYPASVQIGGQDVLGKPVDLFPGSPPLRVVFKSAPGSVHGRVDGAGEDVTVLLIPRDVQTIGYGRMLRLNSSGNFDINGVPPGQYHAVALEHFAMTLPADSDWLAKIAAIGTQVSVAQDSVSVQLKVTQLSD